jgi:type 1 glutamine amidotransferase
MSCEKPQRRFVMHPAHAAVGVAARPARRIDRAHVAAAPQPRMRGIAVALVPGAMDDGWHEALPLLAEALGEDDRFVCRPMFANSKQVPDDLGTCQCLILLGRPAVSERHLRRIEECCRSGRPIVALRSASRAFPSWPEFDREVLGGDYQGQHDAAAVQVILAEKPRRNPLMRGVNPFLSAGSLYENPWLAADANVLLLGAAGDLIEPVAWTRQHHGQRVFYTSLGHPDDFRQPSFLQLLGNAVRWTCRAE